MKFAKMALEILASDYMFAAINYNYLRLKCRMLPRWPNYRAPNSFNEKIVHLKLFHRHPGANVIADKFAVRSFVATRVSEDVLIPLLGVYDRPEDIDFMNLPERFVAKPTHASGLVAFCTKSDLDKNAFISETRDWLVVDYGRQGREYQYRNIPRRILLEKDLREEAVSDDLPDYKFFCFNGEPKFVQVDLDRHTNHRRNFYDLEWNRLPFSLLYPDRPEDAPRPATLPFMIDVARKLSSDMIFGRVDLYEVNNKVYFGEITLHPEGGMGPFSPEYYDRQIGEMLTLPVTEGKRH